MKLTDLLDKMTRWTDFPTDQVTSEEKWMMVIKIIRIFQTDKKALFENRHFFVGISVTNRGEKILILCSVFVETQQLQCLKYFLE